jgi:AraC-like DNA-binding protein
MRYAVHKPRPLLYDFVDNLWSLSDAPAHAREQILPSGTIELVINLQQNEFRIYDSELVGDGCRRFRGAIVSGCYGAPFGIDTREHAAVIGVHFRPGGAAGLLGVPPGEIADAHVGLDDLWGDGATELRERLCAAPDQHERFQILEEALLGRLRRVPYRRSAVKAALARLDQPRIEIGTVANEIGLSRRRFIEIFSEDVGMTPKRYARVRRFQRALARVMQSRSPAWAELALECGYFDQAHLCRDWLEFTGLSPTEFLALRAIEVKENHMALPEEGVKSVQYASMFRT